MGLKRELKNTERNEIIALRSKGLSYKQIAGILSKINLILLIYIDKFGIAKPAVAYTIKMQAETGNNNSRNRSGPMPKFGERDFSKIGRFATQNPSMPSH